MYEQKHIHAEAYAKVKSGNMNARPSFIKNDGDFKMFMAITWMLKK